ncbi:MAG: dephospho-CoA kinase [Symbiobacteriaceae bacterium]|nr:dephospho-CoA kinase [Symbiobacteriaceae bacterium]
MWVIGLTGGIASGKSSVLGWLRGQGCPTQDADLLAREVVAPGEEALLQIKATFGAEYLLPDGALNRPLMGQLIFGDAAARQQLNAIIHPAVVQRLQQKIAEYRQESLQQLPLVLDIPLLFEAELEYLVDSIWCVWLPREVQLRRLQERDRLSPEEARQRLEAQMSLDEKRKKAHVVIDNSASWEETEEQLRKIFVAKLWRC